MLARLRAPMVSTGGAIGADCGRAGIVSFARLTSGGGATGVTSKTGATNFGAADAMAATGGAWGTGLERTMSGIGLLARIFGAAGATMVCVVLSAHFGIAIASTTRLRASPSLATGALELRMITGADLRGTISGFSGSETSTSSSGFKYVSWSWWKASMATIRCQ